jgi:DNA gyrase inhibitor GyrI
MKRFPLLLVGVFAIALGIAACAATRAGYETAPYEVLRADGAFELRAYPELPLATTRNDGADGSFRRLFRYISGANATQEKIAMTTPVFMVDNQMAFVLPAEKCEAPAPTSKDVRLEKRPAGRVAVHRFSGQRSTAADAAALIQLRTWMAQQGLKEAGKPFSASYDPPWTPGPLRRNEVLVPVAAGS